jgi:hypothetical protein
VIDAARSPAEVLADSLPHVTSVVENKKNVDR